METDPLKHEIDPPAPESPRKPSGLSGAKVAGIVVATMLVTMAATLLIVKNWLFPSPFTPVVLSKTEEQQLERKLERFEQIGGRTERDRQERPREVPSTGDLTPEPYSEEGASREIRLSEREINGMIAQNTDLATRMVVDFADDLVSAKLLIPLDPDFPVMGGKILKVRAGAELAFRNGRPVVVLRGISVMGVPLPNAWLGGLKNIDLIREFGADPGFWKSFADGVDTIEVRDGSLRVVLKE
ncbi:arginine N-succinyltransferase [Desulfobulbus elongatus]|uniref:arginine N-succinyltransferase n=1 Tax=Desulfobulbus elongatus TaxID=53332 RepID=UPI0009FDF43A|nr:arginine N-succinyltransferase [Desulfobulbus elongatus]